jgi:hypothetical protein
MSVMALVRFAMCLVVAGGAMGLGVIGGQFDHIVRRCGFEPFATESASSSSRHAASSGFVPYSTGSSHRNLLIVRDEDQIASDTTSPSACNPSASPRVQLPQPGSLTYVYLQFCALRDGGFASDEAFAKRSPCDVDVQDAAEEAVQAKAAR